MPDDTSTAAESQTDATAGGQQAGDSNAGAGTQTAKDSTEGQQQQTQQAKTEKTDTVDITETPEFKLALTKAIEQKLPQLKRQVRKEIAKEVDGDEGGETKPTAEQLTQRLTEAERKNRVYEARDQLEVYVNDKRNNLSVSNVRGLFKFIKDDLKFDDDGQVTNFKDVLAMAKNEAAEFFRAGHGSADGARGNGQVATVSMNDLIRGR